jgi:hypothetical protein
MWKPFGLARRVGFCEASFRATDFYELRQGFQSADSKMKNGLGHNVTETGLLLDALALTSPDGAEE